MSDSSIHHILSDSILFRVKVQTSTTTLHILDTFYDVSIHSRCPEEKGICFNSIYYIHAADSEQSVERKSHYNRFMWRRVAGTWPKLEMILLAENRITSSSSACAISSHNALTYCISMARRKSCRRRYEHWAAPNSARKFGSAVYFPLLLLVFLCCKCQYLNCKLIHFVICNFYV